MLSGKSGTLALALIAGLATVATHAARAEGTASDGAAGANKTFCINGYSRTVDTCEAPVLPVIAKAETGKAACINGYSLVVETCAAPEWRVLRQ